MNVSHHCDVTTAFFPIFLRTPRHLSPALHAQKRGAESRLPWPAGSGLLPSLYISAVGLLCATWQERLPYSVGATAATPTSDHGFDDNAEPTAVVVAVEGLPDARSAGETTVAVKSNGAAGDGVADGENDSGGGVDPDGAGVVGSAGLEAPVVVPSSSPSLSSSISRGGSDAVGGGTGDGGGDPNGRSAGGSEEEKGVASDGKADALIQSGEVGEEAVGAENGAEVREGGTEGGAKSGRRSWLEVGGVLGTPDLYLRNAAYLKREREVATVVFCVLLCFH